MEQVWLLGRVVTVCWLGAALFVLAERGVPRKNADDQTSKHPIARRIIFSFVVNWMWRQP